MSGSAARRAFIGSFTSAGGPGIVVADLDARTGALTGTGVVESVANPSYLAVGPGEAAAVLYAVSETVPGAVAAYDAREAVPRPLGDPVQVGGDEPTHLCLAQGRLLTANYGSGSVSVLPLTAEGVPLPPTGVLRHEGSGPHPERQRSPHAHQVVPDPTGRWILSVDLGTDAVQIRSLDDRTGALRPHGETRLPPGTGPRHLAFHPSGDHAYVLGELRPTVTVCRWDAADGALRAVGETPLFPDGPDGPVQPSAPVVSADGRHLWAAMRGTDTVAVLALDASGERAELVTAVPCGGSWPRDLVLGPTGRHLYAANERSGEVTWFDVDTATGVPRPAGSLPVPAASSVAFG
ncbi:6-phosphogluconolactonase, cycloisomerase 2 family [Actinacidiphila yanglinensis]|uniref:6-phosphogluconolactonase, cycloisomerase 2 family n=1 Tax=Actinacidiphila yanglinensis TaxID=310779 RepID=A0A1H6DPM7_9ACTN|nr:lactonase family protein [Actinacidiphila yanglinensis]SEG87104.1 6-phosphogluconolactonase, cycloisomerase 2 family [Actinacidiphila yanglinensis]